MTMWKAAALMVVLGPAPLPATAATAPTLPPAVAGMLHRGRHLGSIWTAPGFDPAGGFRTGSVALAAGVANLYGPVVTGHFPASLERLADPASGRVLDLTITELTVRERVVSNSASVHLGVEGLVRAGDGTPLAAFATRVASQGGAGVAGNCREAVDQVVAGLAAELGLRLKRPSELRAGARKDTASVPVPATAQPAVPAGAGARGTVAVTGEGANEQSVRASVPPSTSDRPPETQDPKPRGKHF
jgi:hypothetical protein